VEGTLEKPAGGIEFHTPPDTELPVGGENGVADRGERRARVITPLSKVSFPAAAIRFPLETISRGAVDLTGYDGFAFTDEESQVLSDAIAALGAEVSPVLSVVLLSVGIIGGKTVGYGMWRRGLRSQGELQVGNGDAEDVLAAGGIELDEMPANGSEVEEPSNLQEYYSAPSVTDPEEPESEIGESLANGSEREGE